MASEVQHRFDIVIAGGGMIGCCLALALAPLRLRIALVEAVARGESGQPSFDDRSTALSRSSQRMFGAMNLWPAIAAASTPVRRIHVSDRGRFGFAHIDAAEQNVEALGYVVINRVLGEVLQGALPGLQGLDVLCPARITDVQASDDSVEVTVAGCPGLRKLSCSLLVAADGAESTVRELSGIHTSRSDYRQTAVIGNVLPEVPLDGCAYERFSDAGPLALLPVAGGRAAFVWCLATDAAAETMRLDDATFARHLQQAFGGRLGRFDRVGRRASYPLALTRAVRPIARRTVLIGNAANALHPVAAQGFNLGLRDVATLSDCIADALRDDGDRGAIGRDSVLNAYAQWRRGDHLKVTGFTDGLVRVFGNSTPPVRALRALGMLGFDLVPGVRTLFARHTMGLAGRLPRLSRGAPLR